MTGKQKCEVLKQIRHDIAKANDIPLAERECTHKGECKGTCPRCEAEIKMLEKGLASRRQRGLKIALAGISAGLIAVNAASCDALDALTGNATQGDMLPGTGYTSTAGEIVLPEGDLRITEDENTTVEVTEGIIAAPETEELVLQGDMPVEGLK